MWLMRFLLTLTTAGLLVMSPCRGEAGGPADRFGMGKAGGFHRSSSISVPAPVLSVSPPFRFSNRSVWYPSVPSGSGAVYMAPPQVVVVPMLVQQVSNVVPAPAPAPDPKFVYRPTTSAPSH